MLEIDDPKFIELVTSGRSIEELEKILSPNNSSEAGFLGKGERLLEVVHEDWSTVESYGTTHQEIAEALSKAIHGDYELNPDYELKMVAQSMGFQECPFGCGEEYDELTGIGSSGGYELGTGIGYVARNDLSQDEIMEGVKSAMGSEPLESSASKGLTIITELHPHLIGVHYFFEGKGTSYRSDPTVLIPALNLANNS